MHTIGTTGSVLLDIETHAEESSISPFWMQFNGGSELVEPENVVLRMVRPAELAATPAFSGAPNKLNKWSRINGYL